VSQVINYDALIRAFIEDPKFVPRKWLTEEVEHSVGAASGGFVLLTAESGAGKTGLSAALAQSPPDWLRCFSRRDSQTPLSSGDAISFLFSIGNQLALQRPKLFHPDKLEVIVKQRIGELKPGGRAVGLMVEDLVTVQVVKTGIMPRRVLADRFREAETEPLPPARRLHRRR